MSYPIHYHFGGYSIGDCWTWANYMLCLSQEVGRPIRLSRQLPPKTESKDVAYDLMDRIAGLLDSPGSFEWTDEPGSIVTDQKRIWAPPHGFGRLPLKPSLRWDGGSSGRIALQLNGVSGGQAKNPPPADMPRFLALPNVVHLGLPMTLEESIAVMRTCKLMIAVCSGMSHVAHACGIPLIIIEYRQGIDAWHPSPSSSTPWHKAKGTDEAIAIANDIIRNPSWAKI